jgi:hypothetical protein
MTASPQAAAHPGEPTPPTALPWPPELPDGLPRYPRAASLYSAAAAVSFIDPCAGPR